MNDQLQLPLWVTIAVAIIAPAIVPLGNWLLSLLKQLKEDKRLDKKEEREVQDKHDGFVSETFRDYISILKTDMKAMSDNFDELMDKYLQITKELAEAKAEIIFLKQNKK